MNSNAVYVRVQPKHSFATIVVVDEYHFPIEEFCHENLDGFCSFTDVMLVFPKRPKDIIVSKFANLYGICSYYVGEEEGTVTEGLVTMLKYCTEVFDTHSTFLLTDTHYLSSTEGIVTEEFKEKVTGIVLSGLATPVFVKERLSNIELYSRYHKASEPEPETKFWERKKRVEEEKSIRGIWSTHKTETGVIFIRKPIVKNITNEIKEESYIKSFYEKDFRYFIASAVNYLGIDNIQSTIQGMDIKGLKVQ